eukprot:scaffold30418_cov66-Phaeocystis_antarctica.AAC.1
MGGASLWPSPQNTRASHKVSLANSTLRASPEPRRERRRPLPGVYTPCTCHTNARATHLPCTYQAFTLFATGIVSPRVALFRKPNPTCTPTCTADETAVEAKVAAAVNAATAALQADFEFSYDNFYTPLHWFRGHPNRQ